MEAFEWIKVSLILVYSLFWLTFLHNLPEIPLIAYHLIQKEKFYFIGQKTKSPCPFMIAQDRIFEKIFWIVSKLWMRKPNPFRSFFVTPRMASGWTVWYQCIFNNGCFTTLILADLKNICPIQKIWFKFLLLFEEVNSFFPLTLVN